MFASGGRFPFDFFSDQQMKSESRVHLGWGGGQGSGGHQRVPALRSSFFCSRVALGWEMLWSTDSCFRGAVPLLCYPKDSHGSTLPSAHPACPLKRGAGCPCGRASAPPWLLTSPASVPAWIPQPRPTLGKDITLAGSRFPWPFGLYLLFLGKGLW